MKFLTIPVFFASLAAFAPLASATVLTLGQSNENVTFTGIGVNAMGEGQSIVTWGSCTFDGTLTKCSVTGPFTGIGGGGTYSLLLTYPGNGGSPLTAISRSPGSDLIFFNLSSGSFIMTVTETNGPTVTFYNPNTFFFTFVTSTCTGISDCRVSTEGATAGATLTGPISGTFDPTPMISTVISAGDFGAFTSIAPATWIEIYGTNLATILQRQWARGDFNGDLAPDTLGGTTVTIAGLPAYIDYVSPGQVNAQVPSGVPTGSQPVVVTTAGGASANFFVTVNAVEPGLLAPRAFLLKAGQYVVATLANGVTYVLPPGVTNAVPTARAKPGDVIIMYGVGFGPVTPDSPAGLVVHQNDVLQSTFKASFAGVPATVKYQGLVSGFVGLYQFNVVVPDVAASDTVPLTFTLGDNSGPQNLLIAIGQ